MTRLSELVVKLFKDVIVADEKKVLFKFLQISFVVIADNHQVEPSIMWQLR